MTPNEWLLDETRGWVERAGWGTTQNSEGSPTSRGCIVRRGSVGCRESFRPDRYMGRCDLRGARHHFRLPGFVRTLGT
jgi:hypothetical protein